MNTVQEFLVGQPVLASSKKYEGYVVEHERYGQKGTVCVFINWDGDGIYADYEPKHLTPLAVTELTEPMRKSRLEDIKKYSKRMK